MKKITDFHIVEKKRWERAALLKLQSDEPLPEIKAGQFVQVRIDGSEHTYLRRPISIHDVDTQSDTMTLLVQEAGEGTKFLCNLEVGATLNVIYPLGNGFTLPEKDENTLLVGGGIGIAPMLYLGKVIKNQGGKPVFLLGGRSKDDVLLIEEFEKVGKVFITTNDGTLGEKGFVTQHSLWQNQKIDKIYACGPMPMMKAVAKVAKEQKIRCEVSLENMMACGLGACLCCVENTTEGNICVCKEGPVFNINRLLW